MNYELYQQQASEKLKGLTEGLVKKGMLNPDQVSSILSQTSVDPDAAALQEISRHQAELRAGGTPQIVPNEPTAEETLAEVQAGADTRTQEYQQRAQQYSNALPSLSQMLEHLSKQEGVLNAHKNNYAKWAPLITPEQEIEWRYMSDGTRSRMLNRVGVGVSPDVAKGKNHLNMIHGMIQEVGDIGNRWTADPIGATFAQSWNEKSGKWGKAGAPFAMLGEIIWGTIAGTVTGTIDLVQGDAVLEDFLHVGSMAATVFTGGGSLVGTIGKTSATAAKGAVTAGQLGRATVLINRAKRMMAAQEKMAALGTTPTLGFGGLSIPNVLKGGTVGRVSGGANIAELITNPQELLFEIVGDAGIDGTMTLTDKGLRKILDTWATPEKQMNAQDKGIDKRFRRMEKEGDDAVPTFKTAKDNIINSDTLTTEQKVAQLDALIYDMNVYEVTKKKEPENLEEFLDEFMPGVASAYDEDTFQATEAERITEIERQADEAVELAPEEPVAEEVVPEPEDPEGVAAGDVLEPGDVDPLLAPTEEPEVEEPEAAEPNRLETIRENFGEGVTPQSIGITETDVPGVALDTFQQSTPEGTEALRIEIERRADQAQSAAEAFVNAIAEADAAKANLDAEATEANQLAYDEAVQNMNEAHEAFLERVAPKISDTEADEYVSNPEERNQIYERNAKGLLATATQKAEREGGNADAVNVTGAAAINNISKPPEVEGQAEPEVEAEPEVVDDDIPEPAPEVADEEYSEPVESEPPEVVVDELSGPEAEQPSAGLDDIFAGEEPAEEVVEETPLTPPETPVSRIPGEIRNTLLGETVDPDFVRKIHDEIKSGKPFPLIGREVSDPKEFAAIAHISRDPGIEKGTIVLLKDGKISGHFVASLNSWTETAHPAFTDLLGNADSFVFVHNHPNQVMIASAGDINVVSQLKQYYPQQFGGYIIINKNKYVEIDIDSAPDFGTGEASNRTRKKLTGEIKDITDSEIAEFTTDVKYAEKWITVVFSDADNKIKLFMEFGSGVEPMAVVNFQQYVAERIRDNNVTGVDLIVSGPPQSPNSQPIEDIFEGYAENLSRYEKWDGDLSVFTDKESGTAPPDKETVKGQLRNHVNSFNNPAEGIQDLSDKLAITQAKEDKSDMDNLRIEAATELIAEMSAPTPEQSPYPDETADTIYFKSTLSQPKHNHMSAFSQFGFTDAEGKYWQTVEHYFHAQKFNPSQPMAAHMRTRFNIPQATTIYEAIRNANTPYNAARIAHAHDSLVSENWYNPGTNAEGQAVPARRDVAMKTALYYKYTQNTVKYDYGDGPKTLVERLIETSGKELIHIENKPGEESYWGMSAETGTLVGQNRQGQLLMEIRAELTGQTIPVGEHGSLYALSKEQISELRPQADLANAKILPQVYARGNRAILSGNRAIYSVSGSASLNISASYNQQTGRTDYRYLERGEWQIEDFRSKAGRFGIDPEGLSDNELREKIYEANRVMQEGDRYAKDYGRAVATRGEVVAMGGARGVDQNAAEGADSAGGDIVTLSPNSIDEGTVFYPNYPQAPRRQRGQEQQPTVVPDNVLVMSLVPPGAPPGYQEALSSARNYDRNNMVASLGDSLFVPVAYNPASGTADTVDKALLSGRPVFILSQGFFSNYVPGNAELAKKQGVYEIPFSPDMLLENGHLNTDKLFEYIDAVMNMRSVGQAAIEQIPIELQNRTVDWVEQDFINEIETYRAEAQTAKDNGEFFKDVVLQWRIKQLTRLQVLRRQSSPASNDSPRGYHTPLTETEQQVRGGMVGLWSYNSAEQFISALKSLGDNVVFVETRANPWAKGNVDGEFGEQWHHGTALAKSLEEAGIPYVDGRIWSPHIDTRRKQTAEDELASLQKQDRVVLGDRYINGYFNNIKKSPGADMGAFISDVIATKMGYGDPANAVVVFGCVERAATACHRSLIGDIMVHDLGMRVIDMHGAIPVDYSARHEHDHTREPSGPAPPIKRFHPLHQKSVVSVAAGYENYLPGIDSEMVLLDFQTTDTGAVAIYGHSEYPGWGVVMRKNPTTGEVSPTFIKPGNLAGEELTGFNLDMTPFQQPFDDVNDFASLAEYALRLEAPSKRYIRRVYDNDPGHPEKPELPTQPGLRYRYVATESHMYPVGLSPENERIGATNVTDTAREVSVSKDRTNTVGRGPYANLGDTENKTLEYWLSKEGRIKAHLSPDLRHLRIMATSGEGLSLPHTFPHRITLQERWGDFLARDTRNRPTIVVGDTERALTDEDLLWEYLTNDPRIWVDNDIGGLPESYEQLPQDVRDAVYGDIDKDVAQSEWVLTRNFLLRGRDVLLGTQEPRSGEVGAARNFVERLPHPPSIPEQVKAYLEEAYAQYHRLNQEPDTPVLSVPEYEEHRRVISVVNIQTPFNEATSTGYQGEVEYDESQQSEMSTGADTEREVGEYEETEIAPDLEEVEDEGYADEVRIEQGEDVNWLETERMHQVMRDRGNEFGTLWNDGHLRLPQSRYPEGHEKAGKRRPRSSGRVIATTATALKKVLGINRVSPEFEAEARRNILDSGDQAKIEVLMALNAVERYLGPNYDSRVWTQDIGEFQNLLNDLANAYTYIQASDVEFEIVGWELNLPWLAAMDKDVELNEYQEGLLEQAEETGQATVVEDWVDSQQRRAKQRMRREIEGADWRRGWQRMVFTNTGALVPLASADLYVVDGNNVYRKPPWQVEGSLARYSKFDADGNVTEKLFSLRHNQKPLFKVVRENDTEFIATQVGTGITFKLDKVNEEVSIVQSRDGNPVVAPIRVAGWRDHSPELAIAKAVDDGYHNSAKIPLNLWEIDLNQETWSYHLPDAATFDSDTDGTHTSNDYRFTVSLVIREDLGGFAYEINAFRGDEPANIFKPGGVPGNAVAIKVTEKGWVRNPSVALTQVIATFQGGEAMKQWGAKAHSIPEIQKPLAEHEILKDTTPLEAIGETVAHEETWEETYSDDEIAPITWTVLRDVYIERLGEDVVKRVERGFQRDAPVTRSQAFASVAQHGGEVNQEAWKKAVPSLLQHDLESREAYEPHPDSPLKIISDKFRKIYTYDGISDYTVTILEGSGVARIYHGDVPQGAEPNSEEETLIGEIPVYSGANISETIENGMLPVVLDHVVQSNLNLRNRMDEDTGDIIYQRRIGDDMEGYRVRITQAGMAVGEKLEDEEWVGKEVTERIMSYPNSRAHQIQRSLDIISDLRQMDRILEASEGIEEGKEIPKGLIYRLPRHPDDVDVFAGDVSPDVVRFVLPDVPNIVAELRHPPKGVRQAQGKRVLVFREVDTGRYIRYVDGGIEHDIFTQPGSDRVVFQDRFAPYENLPSTRFDEPLLDYTPDPERPDEVWDDPHSYGHDTEGVRRTVMMLRAVHNMKRQFVEVDGLSEEQISSNVEQLWRDLIVFSGDSNVVTKLQVPPQPTFSDEFTTTRSIVTGVKTKVTKTIPGRRVWNPTKVKTNPDGTQSYGDYDVIKEKEVEEYGSIPPGVSEQYTYRQSIERHGIRTQIQRYANWMQEDAGNALLVPPVPEIDERLIDKNTGKPLIKLDQHTFNPIVGIPDFSPYQYLESIKAVGKVRAGAGDVQSGTDALTEAFSLLQGELTPDQRVAATQRFMQGLESQDRDAIAEMADTIEAEIARFKEEVQTADRNTRKGQPKIPITGLVPTGVALSVPGSDIALHVTSVKGDGTRVYHAANHFITVEVSRNNDNTFTATVKHDLGFGEMTFEGIPEENIQTGMSSVDQTSPMIQQVYQLENEVGLQINSFDLAAALGSHLYQKFSDMVSRNEAGAASHPDYPGVTYTANDWWGGLNDGVAPQMLPMGDYGAKPIVSQQEAFTDAQKMRDDISHEDKMSALRNLASLRNRRRMYEVAKGDAESEYYKLRKVIITKVKSLLNTEEDISIQQATDIISNRRRGEQDPFMITHLDNLSVMAQNLNRIRRITENRLPALIREVNNEAKLVQRQSFKPEHADTNYNRFDIVRAMYNVRNNLELDDIAQGRDVDELESLARQRIEERPDRGVSIFDIARKNLEALEGRAVGDEFLVGGRNVLLPLMLRPEDISGEGTVNTATSMQGLGSLVNEETGLPLNISRRRDVVIREENENTVGGASYILENNPFIAINVGYIQYSGDPVLDKIVIDVQPRFSFRREDVHTDTGIAERHYSNAPDRGVPDAVNSLTLEIEVDGVAQNREEIESRIEGVASEFIVSNMQMLRFWMNPISPQDTYLGGNKGNATEYGVEINDVKIDAKLVRQGGWVVAFRSKDGTPLYETVPEVDGDSFVGELMGRAEESIPEGEVDPEAFENSEMGALDAQYLHGPYTSFVEASSAQHAIQKAILQKLNSREKFNKPEDTTERVFNTYSTLNEAMKFQTLYDNNVERLGRALAHIQRQGDPQADEGSGYDDIIYALEKRNPDTLQKILSESKSGAPLFDDIAEGLDDLQNKNVVNQERSSLLNSGNIRVVKEFLTEVSDEIQDIINSDRTDAEKRNARVGVYRNLMDRWVEKFEGHLGAGIYADRFGPHETSDMVVDAVLLSEIIKRSELNPELLGENIGGLYTSVLGTSALLDTTDVPPHVSVAASIIASPQGRVNVEGNGWVQFFTKGEEITRTDEDPQSRALTEALMPEITWEQADSKYDTYITDNPSSASIKELMQNVMRGGRLVIYGNSEWVMNAVKALRVSRSDMSSAGYKERLTAEGMEETNSTQQAELLDMWKSLDYKVQGSVEFTGGGNYENQNGAVIVIDNAGAYGTHESTTFNLGEGSLASKADYVSKFKQLAGTRQPVSVHEAMRAEESKAERAKQQSQKAIEEAYNEPNKPRVYAIHKRIKHRVLELGHQIKERGVIARGTEVGSIEEMAVLAELSRDPRMATTQIVTLHDGVVQHSVLGSAKSGGDIKPKTTEIERLMPNTEMDTVIIVNRPSGNTTPTAEDIAVAKNMTERHSGFKYLLIRNGETYSVIDRDGAPHVNKLVQGIESAPQNVHHRPLPPWIDTSRNEEVDKFVSQRQAMIENLDAQENNPQTLDTYRLLDRLVESNNNWAVIALLNADGTLADMIELPNAFDLTQEEIAQSVTDIREGYGGSDAYVILRNDDTGQNFFGETSWGQYLSSNPNVTGWYIRGAANALPGKYIGTTPGDRHRPRSLTVEARDSGPNARANVTRNLETLFHAGITGDIFEKAKAMYVPMLSRPITESQPLSETELEDLRYYLNAAAAKHLSGMGEKYSPHTKMFNVMRQRFSEIMSDWEGWQNNTTMPLNGYGRSVHPAYAYLMHYVADVKEGELVVIPDAGGNTLAGFTSGPGGQYLTESNQTWRGELIRSLDLDPMQVGGASSTDLSTYWTTGAIPNPDVVLLDSRNLDDLWVQTIEAMRILKPGGRLVAHANLNAPAEVLNNFRGSYKQILESIRQNYRLQGFLMDENGHVIMVIENSPPAEGTFNRAESITEPDKFLMRIEEIRAGKPFSEIAQEIEELRSEPEPEPDADAEAEEQQKHVEPEPIAEEEIEDVGETVEEETEPEEVPYDMEDDVAFNDWVEQMRLTPDTIPEMGADYYAYIINAAYMRFRGGDKVLDRFDKGSEINPWGRRVTTAESVYMERTPLSTYFAIYGVNIIPGEKLERYYISEFDSTESQSDLFRRMGVTRDNVDMPTMIWKRGSQSDIIESLRDAWRALKRLAPGGRYIMDMDIYEGEKYNLGNVLESYFGADPVEGLNPEGYSNALNILFGNYNVRAYIDFSTHAQLIIDKPPEGVTPDNSGFIMRIVDTPREAAEVYQMIRQIDRYVSSEYLGTAPEKLFEGTPERPEIKVSKSPELQQREIRRAQRNIPESNAPDPGKTMVMVHGLRGEVTENDIAEKASQYGTVLNVNIPSDRSGGPGQTERGDIGYVMMDSPEAATQVINNLNQTLIKNNLISVLPIKKEVVRPHDDLPTGNPDSVYAWDTFLSSPFVPESFKRQWMQFFDIDKVPDGEGGEIYQRAEGAGVPGKVRKRWDEVWKRRLGAALSRPIDQIQRWGESGLIVARKMKDVYYDARTRAGFSSTLVKDTYNELYADPDIQELLKQGSVEDVERNPNGRLPSWVKKVKGIGISVDPNTGFEIAYNKKTGEQLTVQNAEGKWVTRVRLTHDALMDAWMNTFFGSNSQEIIPGDSAAFDKIRDAVNKLRGEFDAQDTELINENLSILNSDKLLTHDNLRSIADGIDADAVKEYAAEHNIPMPDDIEVKELPRVGNMREWVVTERGNTAVLYHLREFSTIESVIYKGRKYPEKLKPGTRDYDRHYNSIELYADWTNRTLIYKPNPEMPIFSKKSGVEFQLFVGRPHDMPRMVNWSGMDPFAEKHTIFTNKRQRFEDYLEIFFQINEDIHASEPGWQYNGKDWTRGHAREILIRQYKGFNDMHFDALEGDSELVYPSSAYESQPVLREYAEKSAQRAAEIIGYGQDGYHISEALNELRNPDNLELSAETRALLKLRAATGHDDYERDAGEFAHGNILVPYSITKDGLTRVTRSEFSKLTAKDWETLVKIGVVTDIEDSGGGYYAWAPPDGDNSTAKQVWNNNEITFKIAPFAGALVDPALLNLQDEFYEQVNVAIYRYHVAKQALLQHHTWHPKMIDARETENRVRMANAKDIVEVGRLQGQKLWQEQAFADAVIKEQERLRHPIYKAMAMLQNMSTFMFLRLSSWSQVGTLHNPAHRVGMINLAKGVVDDFSKKEDRQRLAEASIYMLEMTDMIGLQAEAVSQDRVGLVQRMMGGNKDWRWHGHGSLKNLGVEFLKRGNQTPFAWFERRLRGSAAIAGLHHSRSVLADLLIPSRTEHLTAEQREARRAQDIYSLEELDVTIKPLLDEVLALRTPDGGWTKELIDEITSMSHKNAKEKYASQPDLAKVAKLADRVMMAMPDYAHFAASKMHTPELLSKHPFLKFVTLFQTIMIAQVLNMKNMLKYNYNRLMLPARIAKERNPEMASLEAAGLIGAEVWRAMPMLGLSLAAIIGSGYASTMLAHMARFEQPDDEDLTIQAALLNSAVLGVFTGIVENRNTYKGFERIAVGPTLGLLFDAYRDFGQTAKYYGLRPYPLDFRNALNIWTPDETVDPGRSPFASGSFDAPGGASVRGISAP